MKPSGRWLSALALVTACSFDTGSGGAGLPPVADDTTGGETGYATAQPTGSAGEGTSANPTGNPATSSTPPDSDDPTIDPGTSGGEDTEDNPTGGIDVDIGCPVPLPEGWVLCEDFEDIANPDDHFADWEGAGVQLEGPGLDSPTALAITHFANQNWSGVARMRFGAGPDAVNVAAPEGEFDELWVRFHSRIEQGWPTGGPGDLLTIDGMSTNPTNATAFLARVTADQFESVMRSSVFSCIFSNDLWCDGSNDWDVMAFLGADIGAAELFTPSAAGEWSCIVLHARLNTPGQSNGVLEVLVGESLDSRLENVDFRNERTDFRFNRVSLPTYIQNTQTVDMHRWIDDVVVSTVSLDCD